MGIVEKAKKQEGGIVNHKSLFNSVIHKHFNGVKIGICGLHYHPSDPFLFIGFFQQSLFLV